MAVDVRILLKPDQLRSVERALDAVPNGAARAIPAALNKAGAKARTSIARRVAAGIGAKYGDMTRRITLVKASPKVPTATIKLKGLNIVLAKTRDGASPPASGLYALGVTSAPESLPHHAFRQTMLSGHVGVFVRLALKRTMAKGRYAGKVRQAIAQVYAPAPSTFWETAPGVASDEMAKIAADLPSQLQSQINRLLNARGS